MNIFDNLMEYFIKKFQNKLKVYELRIMHEKLLFEIEMLNDKRPLEQIMQDKKHSKNKKLQKLYNTVKILRLTGYNASNCSIDFTEDVIEKSHLYYERCVKILDEVVKGEYKILECNGIVHCPYCIVKVEGDVIGFVKECYLYGIYFKEVTGNFYF